MQQPDVHPRVLVMENYAEVAELETAIAAMRGCRVDRARTSEHALRFLEENSYDVILADAPLVVLPGVLLLDLLAGDLQRLARKTVILTTHIHDYDVRTRAAEAGVYAVLAKPFDVTDLGSIILDCAFNEGRPGTTRWIGISAPSFATRADAQLAAH
jgi:two-component system, OmpR family, response regulator QseB